MPKGSREALHGMLSMLSISDARTDRFQQQTGGLMQPEPQVTVRPADAADLAQAVEGAMA